MIKGLLKIVLFSVSIMILSRVAQIFLPEHIIYNGIYWIIGYMWLLYTVVQVSGHLLRDYLNIDSPLIALAGVSARLIISLFTMLIVVMSGVENMVLLVSNFMVIYLLYLMFEIIILLSNLRRNSSQEQKVK